MADAQPGSSRTIIEGRDRAPARSYYKAIGFDDEALAKPIIGIANTWIETMPCNFNLRRLAAKVKEGVRAAGGTPMEFNTIAISDGITMGTEGMKASLVSREVIADSIELSGRGYMFDAIVALVGCDKTLPGAAMALARLNVPSLILYGGSIAPGTLQGEGHHDPERLRGGRRRRRGQDHRRRAARDRGPRLPRRRCLRRPVYRQHHGYRAGVHRPLAHVHGERPGHRPAQRTGRLPLRQPDHGHAEAESPPARHPDPRRLRQRDRQRRRHRRLDQRRAAPAGLGPRDRRGA